VRVTTASGGAHIWLRLPAGHKIGSTTFAPDIDVRSDGFVVAPGTSTLEWGDWTFDGPSYLAPECAPVGECPRWVLDRLAERARDNGAACDAQPAADIDVDALPQQLRKLLNDEPGDDRSKQEFHFACVAIRAGLDDPAILAALTHYPPSVERGDVLRHGRMAIGKARARGVCSTVREEAPPPDDPPPEDDPPPRPPVAPLRVIAVRQTLVTPPPEPEPLASGLVNKGELVVMGAGRAWNKSLFVAQLGWKLCEGDCRFLRDFWIKRPCRVAIAQGEVTHHQSWIRWHHLSDDGEAPEGLDEIFDPWKIRTIRKRRRDPVEDCYEEWPEAVLDPRLEQAVAENDYDILFLDPWATYFSGSENSNDEVEAALDQLRILSIRYGLAIWINHHFSQRGMTDKIDPEDAWRGASRLADWATIRITLLPHYTPKKAQELGLSRYEARRYLDVRFLTRGAPIDDFSLHRRDDLWLERWDDPDTGDADDHVEALVDPVVAVVNRATAAGQTVLSKQDVKDGLRAARVKFNNDNVVPAVIAAAERGLITAHKVGTVWKISLPEKAS
jgi:hypothetical protein